MERKLPDDHFEEFLRNSFDSYKQEPSDKVWDKLNASLDATPSDKGYIIRFKKYLLPIAASLVAITLTFLVYSNYSLKNKLNVALAKNSKENGGNIEATLRTNENTSVQSQTKDSNTNNQASSGITNTESPSTIANSSIPTSEGTEVKSNSKDQSNSTHTNNSQKVNTNTTSIVAGNAKEVIKKEEKKIDRFNTTSTKTVTSTSNFSKIVKNKRASSIRNVATNEIKSDHQSTSKTNQPNLSDTKTKSASPNSNSSDVASEKSHETVKQSQTIDSKPILNNESIDPKQITRSLVTIHELKSDIKSLNHTTSNSVFQNIYPFYPHSSLVKGLAADEIQVYGGTLNESGTIKDQFKPAGPGGPFNPEHDRINTFATARAWQAGIGLNKSLANNFYATVGITYKHFELINIISQNLQFKERRPQGPLPGRHNFDFKINCNGGSSDIVIESEQLDSRASISDSQQLKLQVTTPYSLNYVTIPLGLQYRLNKNKFFVGLGVGVNVDILSGSNFSTPTVQFRENILKSVSSSSTNRPKFNKTHDLVLNTKLNLNLGYSLTSKIKAYVAPEIYIPLSDRGRNPGTDVDVTTWGVQAGIMYGIN